MTPITRITALRCESVARPADPAPAVHAVDPTMVDVEPDVSRLPSKHIAHDVEVDRTDHLAVPSTLVRCKAAMSRRTTCGDEGLDNPGQVRIPLRLLDDQPARHWRTG